MTWLLVLAWVVLLGALAIVAQQGFGFNLHEAVKQVVTLPLPEKAMVVSRSERTRNPAVTLPGPSRRDSGFASSARALE